MPLSPGQTLIAEGESAGPVFLLLEAMVKVTMRVSRGPAFLALRIGGDIVGEMAVADGGVRSATVTVLRDRGMAVVVPGDGFLAVMGRYPAAGRLLAAGLSRKLRASDRRWADLTAHRVEVRVARVLAQLADDYAQPEPGRPSELALRIGITQRELATLVGAKEAAVSCALKKLRAQHILTWGYQSATISDIESLRMVASQGNSS